jgi:hypothetical protein
MYSRLRIHTVPTAFQRHYKINEYDGSESVKILYSRWFVDQARDVLHGTGSSMSKLDALERLLVAYATHSGVHAAHDPDESDE